MPESGGSMLTLTFDGSMRVMPNYNVMGVAKAALEASVRYLAGDFGRDRIRVNAISAGPVRTLAGSGIGDARAMFAFQQKHSPLGRGVTLDDIGGSALYLLSDLSAGVTGEIHYVDSGYNIISMPRPEDLKAVDTRKAPLHINSKVLAADRPRHADADPQCFLARRHRRCYARHRHLTAERHRVGPAILRNAHRRTQRDAGRHGVDFRFSARVGDGVRARLIEQFRRRRHHETNAADIIRAAPTSVSIKGAICAPRLRSLTVTLLLTRYPASAPTPSRLSAYCG